MGCPKNDVTLSYIVFFVIHNVEKGVVNLGMEGSGDYSNRNSAFDLIEEGVLL